MRFITGMRGETFRYQEEEYNYDLTRDTTIRKYGIGSVPQQAGWLEIKEHPNALVEKGAHWTFTGSGQALSEILTTMSK